MANKNDDRLTPEPPETEPQTQVREEVKPDDDELKITVKKLDRLVRPRGVLADG